MVTMMEMEVMMTLKPRTEPFLALDAKGGVVEGKVKFGGFRGRSTEEKQRAMFLKNGCLYFFYLSLQIHIPIYRVVSNSFNSVGLEYCVLCCNNLSRT